MSERAPLIEARELRERKTYRWGPWPWDESDASEPRVEVLKAELDALLDVLVEAEDVLEARTMGARDRLRAAVQRFTDV